MPEFLKLLPPDQALELIIKNIQPISSAFEVIDTISALGRVTAMHIQSPEPLPAFPRSTVDGFAVRAIDTFGCSESLPSYLNLIGEIPMGKASELSINPGETAQIHTGGMLPSGTDAVVMLENAQVINNVVEIQRPVAMGENIIMPGEDVSSGEEIIKSATILRPSEIGGLMALGLTKVKVKKRLSVGIISSGDELICPDQKPSFGQIRDINSYSLGVLVQQHGGIPKYYGIAEDKPQPILEKLSTAFLECDLVVITAGSSASARDLTSSVIQQIGEPGVLVHGINIRPGKPTILAVCQGKPIIGLPGNPVSALIIATLFVIPIMNYILGFENYNSGIMIPAVVTTNIPSQAGREDWVPVKLSNKNNIYYADPIFYKSNLIFSLSKADGIAMIPVDATGVSSGDKVMVRLL